METLQYLENRLSTFLNFFYKNYVKRFLQLTRHFYFLYILVEFSTNYLSRKLTWLEIVKWTTRLKKWNFNHIGRFSRYCGVPILLLHTVCHIMVNQNKIQSYIACKMFIKSLISYLDIMFSNLRLIILLFYVIIILG